jgi:GNAT superfamily N-acetyltransferase
MFEEYFAEEYGRLCLKDEDGFLLYGIHGEECHLAEMYTAPQARGTYSSKKRFTKLIEVAREAGCTHISTIVSTGELRVHKATRLLRCFLSLGFEFTEARNNVILIYNLGET